MKYIYLIVSVLIFTSCSNDDDSIGVRENDWQNEYVYVSPATLKKGNQVIIEFNDNVNSFQVLVQEGDGYFIDCNGDIDENESYNIIDCNKVINYYPTDSKNGNSIKFIVNNDIEFSMNYNVPRTN
tara:strand:- start:391 stop:768 length:378 start_codon:yes stop_codon:yes gene_type:complete